MPRLAKKIEELLRPKESALILQAKTHRQPLREETGKVLRSQSMK
jgi:hypothetical protein